MSTLPPRPSLEQLGKQAKELVRAARAGDAAARQRFAAADRRWQTSTSGLKLADAQLVIAREYGFASWERLARHVRDVRGDGPPSTPLIRPVELRPGLAYALADGTIVTTNDVFEMFVAARAGDMDTIRRGISRAPGLATVEYNYTPPIHFAVREGHRAIVELLIERGADLAYRSYPFQDSLLTIADDHEQDEVSALLRRHIARKYRLADGMHAILEAAKSGDAAAVRSELARDRSLAAAANDTGDTALHQAARRRSLEIVETLLEAGADPDAVRGDGYRPIHLALMTDFVAGRPSADGREIADRLRARGARYSMFIAALLGDEDSVRAALARDRSLANEEDTNHHRPISAAARRGDLHLVALLLEHGADPTLPEEGAPGGHALWTAVYDNREDMARLLLARGADPNAMVESSGRPIDMARDKPALLALLREHGGIEFVSPRDLLGRAVHEHRFDEVERIVAANPSMLNGPEWGDGVLAGPANAGDHEVLAVLLRLGARVPAVSKWAPYYYFKHERTAAFLLDHGMDANHMNWHRLTLLHHMAAEGEVGKARLLLDHGAAIDAIDEEYRSTPLGVAARRGQLATIELLLERGADVNLAGAPWATPAAWAAKRGHDAVAARLALEPPDC